MTTISYRMTTISYRTLEYIGSAKKNKYCSNNKTVLAMFRVMSAGENSEKDKIVCVNGSVLCTFVFGGILYLQIVRCSAP